MKKILASLAVAFGAAFMAAPASATVISFADYAAGNEQGVTSGTSLNINGVNLTFSSNFNPYFDDVSGGLPAGLGVCRELTQTFQCADPGDDSTDGDMGTNEYIIIGFDDGPFNVREISFRDGQHNLINDSDGLVEWGKTVSGMWTTGIATFAEVVALAAAGFFDNATEIGFNYNNTEFYIEYISDIPVPAALPLLLSGLAGLGFAARRKKKVA